MESIHIKSVSLKEIENKHHLTYYLLTTDSQSIQNKLNLSKLIQKILLLLIICRRKLSIF